MGKLKLIILVIVLAGLSVVTYQLFNKEKSSLSAEALSDFAIKDTASIDRLIISSNSGGMIDFKKIEGKWGFADGGCIQIHMIHSFLETIKYVAIKSPVPRGAVENVNKLTLAQHKKIEIFQNGKLTKTWFIGTTTSDHYGTNMILKIEGIGISPEPFITFQPNVYGNLADQFSLRRKDYECSGIFVYKNLFDIKEIDIINHEDSTSNFTIKSMDTNTFKLYSNGAEVQNFDTVNVREYIAGFAKMHYDVKEPSIPKEIRDSIVDSPPYYTIKVTDKNGRVTSLITHLKGAIQQEFDYDGNLITIDRDNLYAVTDDSVFVMLQYYVFGKAFKKLSDFKKN